jgi:hypothetical protein
MGIGTIPFGYNSQGPQYIQFATSPLGGGTPTVKWLIGPDGTLSPVSGSKVLVAKVGATNLVGTVPLENLGGITSEQLEAATDATYRLGAGTNAGPLTLVSSGGIVGVNAATPEGCVPNGTLTYRLTLTENVVIANPFGALDGQRGVFEFLQDSTGGWNVSWGEKFVLSSELAGKRPALAGGLAVAINSVPNKRTRVNWVYWAADDIYFIESVSTQP